MLKHHEEIKVLVLKMVRDCENCGDNYCGVHARKIHKIQKKEDFDAEAYI